MRRLVTAALLVLALAAPAAASAGDSLRLTGAGGARFPDRSFVLTVPPGTSLSGSQVHVRENGDGVRAESLAPATTSGSDRFGVVLVIDTSSSMRGEPLRGAIAAARKFAAKRSPQQKLGIVTFDRSARTLLAPTADAHAIDRALARVPSTSGGTRIYDAVNSALALLQQARISAGSVIVLSDGADNGSTTSAAAAAQRAIDEGARIYSVGLRDRHYDATSLTQLAGTGRGDYAEAASAHDLAAIYDRLASQLANQYLLSYRSVQDPGVKVRVEVVAEGVGQASANYATPALPKAGAGGGEDASWTSGPLVFVFIFGAALLISTALIALIVIVGRRRRLEDRMSGFLAATDPGGDHDGGHVRSTAFVEGAERSLERLRWWPAFKEDVDLARIEIPAVKIAMWTVVAAVAVLTLFIALGSAWVGVVLAPLIVAAVRLFVRFKARRQRAMFAEQLADNLQVIASAMRAGNSFVGALSVAAQDAAEPTRRELQRAITDEQLGVQFDDALRSVSRRMDNRDLTQVVLVAALQRETGGNTAEILDRVADTIRERMALRRFVRTLTAQGRMTHIVVTALPIALGAVIATISPGYLDPLFHTGTGHILIVVAIMLLVTGSLAIRRIVNIEV